MVTNIWSVRFSSYKEEYNYFKIYFYEDKKDV